MGAEAKRRSEECSWEKKIEDYRDKYVKKFSAMETAMAKLQSQTASLSSFFGTGM
jgi:flagellar hook-associated protein 2